MKNLIILMSILLFSCENSNTSSQQYVNYNYKTHTMNNIYYLNYNLSGDFEIIFNGILLTRNKKEGVMMNYEYLNPYILKSGTQTVTFLLKPFNSDYKLIPKLLNDIVLHIYISENNTEPPFEKIIDLKLPEYKESQDSILYTWTFDADVPYEITTLNDAKNLRDEDHKKLLEDVVAEYKKVHKLINEGQINEYMNLYKSSREREMVSMYYNEVKQKEYLQDIKKRALSSKSFMKPIENYKLFIHPNNKLVEIMINDGQNSALYSVDGKGKRKAYGLQLYRSSKTGKLEIY